MTSSRRCPGATRDFRPRATRTHRRHAVVVVGAKRRCRPLPLPSDPRGVADPRARRPDVDAPSIRRVSRGATARLGTDAIAVVSPGAAGLVLAEVKKRTERRPRGSLCRHDFGAAPDCVPLLWVISPQARRAVGGDESTGNGPAGHHKQPGARLRASGVHGGAGGQGVHALVRGPSRHPTPDRATNYPQDPPRLPAKRADIQRRLPPTIDRAGTRRVSWITAGWWVAAGCPRLTPRSSSA